MEEQVLHEFKVIETEDGFRIEIKGDKERLKEMGFGPAMRFMRGMGWHHGPRGRHHKHHWKGPRGRRHHFGFGHGPMPWWFYEEVDEDEAPASGPEADKPPADV